MDNYYGIDLDEKRKELLSSLKAKTFVDKVISDADKAINEEVLALKMSDYLLFFKTGDRKKFQTGYYQRRNNCHALLFAYWLTEDEKYLEPLIDYVGYICDEYTWCLPAHININDIQSEMVMERIDLFHAETARLFAEIVMCVGDKLPSYILFRMKKEVERRVFPSLDRGYVYWWEDCKLNWATVCGSGCLLAALYFGDDNHKEAYVNRFQKCLDTYLEQSKDGCSREGILYWNYGFGHFVMLAQIIRIYTDGKIDYFKKPEVHEYARFLSRVTLSNSKTVAFSDAKENLSFNIALISFLINEYDDILTPNLDFGTYVTSSNSMWSLLWFDVNFPEAKVDTSSHYYEDAQWYIKKTKTYSFAAKGGNNDEPHNHNDIGSFMLVYNDKVIVSDLGSGIYTRQTFFPETRYDYIQNSSRGHSVPIINGKYQIAGAEYKAKNAKATDNEFYLDIESAYESGIINRISRLFTFEDNKVYLKDTFEFSDKTESITERLVSKNVPEVTDNSVIIENTKLSFDSDKFKVKISKDTLIDKEEIPVYIIDFEPISDEKTFKLEITFA